MFKYIFLLGCGLLLLFNPTLTNAEEITIDEIIVVAPSNTNYQIQQYDSELFENSFRIQETSPGMPSPYIGPFTGNQVDQTLNGIRFNNSYFRSGPNQYWGWIPNSFTRNVTVSDGGNIGGTLNRTLGVPSNGVKLSYDSALQGTETTMSYNFERFSFAVNEVDNRDVRTANGTVPNSSYNQKAAMAEAFWDDNNTTTFLYSRSDDLKRTDKWNGGIRITGPRTGQVYNYELQEYFLLVHNYTTDRLEIDLGYQRFNENILDKTTRTEVGINVYNLNSSFNLTDTFTLYSVNQFEDINYATIGVTQTSDWYNTYRFGFRTDTQLGNFNLKSSLGYKVVTVTGLDNFEAPEYSTILSNNGYFVSYDVTTNAPSYTSIKQDKTTGRGQVIPNSSLTQEYAQTWRIGRQTKNFYADVYYKHLKDAYDQITIAKDTYQIVNDGWVKAYGATLGFTQDNLFGSGMILDTRLELIRATKSVIGSNNTEPASKTAPAILFTKLSKNGYYAEFSYQPKDNDLAFKDQDDVRIYGHNNGYKVINLGRTGTIARNFEYEFVIKNILNNNGRVLGSSVDVPARGVYFGIKYIGF